MLETSKFGIFRFINGLQLQINCCWLAGFGLRWCPLCVKHGKKTFLEGKGLDGEQEVEADKFARDLLIPLKAYKEFLARSGLSLAEIEYFANTIEIAPGIVVGRLQHDGYLAHNVGNKLKVFYRWADADK